MCGGVLSPPRTCDRLCSFSRACRRACSCVEAESAGERTALADAMRDVWATRPCGPEGGGASTSVRTCCGSKAVLLPATLTVAVAAAADVVGDVSFALLPAGEDPSAPELPLRAGVPRGALPCTERPRFRLAARPPAASDCTAGDCGSADKDGGAARRKVAGVMDGGDMDALGAGRAPPLIAEDGTTDDDETVTAEGPDTKTR